MPAENKLVSELFKSLFDFFKHLSTLSSGGILLILALADKLNLKDKNFLFGALFALSVSMLTSVISMAVLAFHSNGDKPSGTAMSLLTWAMAMTAIGFCGGLMFIILVSLKHAG